jgi:aryl-alcohol dehydrogenase-like predicted oxidoreductase
MGDGETATGAPAYVRKALEASLRRLQTDWVDLYQYHRPDGVTPVEETLGVLDELVQEGKVRAIGSSNFTPQLVEEAQTVAAKRGATPFVTEQSEYSWLAREVEDELLPTCERLGIGFIPYFPLASGLLTGKYRRGEPAPEDTRLHGRTLEEEKLDHVERLETFAAERGVALLDVAIGGLAAVAGVVSVIAGATKPEQVRANAAAGGWEPTPDDLAALRSL